MKRLSTRWMISLLLIASISPAITLGASNLLLLQDQQFKAGEKVEYKESEYAKEWKEGVVVRILPGNTQLLIRSKPDQWFKDGLEQATALSNVRRIAARSVNDSPANTHSSRPPADGGAGEKADKDDSPTSSPINSKGAGLMTKEEIIEYLRTRVGTDGPHPKKEQVSKELVGMIKRRRVNFRLPPNDLHQISKVGGNDTTYDVKSAIQHNYGPPTPSSWLMGTWNMIIVGATVDTAPGDGYIYRQNESAARMGFLSINPNGTYVWKVSAKDPPSKYVKGAWRKATAKEMLDQGGEGVVWFKGESGEDWIVTKSTNPYHKGDHITVALLSLTYRGGQRRTGVRR